MMAACGDHHQNYQHILLSQGLDESLSPHPVTCSRDNQRHRDAQKTSTEKCDEQFARPRKPPGLCTGISQSFSGLSRKKEIPGTSRLLRSFNNEPQLPAFRNSVISGTQTANEKGKHSTSLPTSLPPFKKPKTANDEGSKNSSSTVEYNSLTVSQLIPVARSSAIIEDKSLHSSSLRLYQSRYSVENILGNRKQKLAKSCPPTSTNHSLDKNHLAPSPLCQTVSHLSKAQVIASSLTTVGNKPTDHTKASLDISVWTPSSSISHEPLKLEPPQTCAEMEGDSSIIKTLLSVIWQKGMLGASVFSTDTMKLQLMQDVPEINNFVSTRQLCVQVMPDAIITSASMDQRFLEMLKDFAFGQEGEGECRLITIPNKELGFQIAKEKLQLACDISLSRGKVNKEALNASLANDCYINMVRSAGGLLRYIELNSSSLLINSSTIGSNLPVLSMELFYMQSQVWIDKTTLSSLKIIYLADHPSTTLGSLYTRDGFSLYGLLDRCKTTMGKKKLKEWLLKPSRDIALLRERFQCLEFFSPLRYTEIVQLLKMNLVKLRNMTPSGSHGENLVAKADPFEIICSSFHDFPSLFIDKADKISRFHRRTAPQKPKSVNCLLQEKTTDETTRIHPTARTSSGCGRIVNQMRYAGLSSAEWLSTHQVFHSLIVITEICSQNQQHLPVFRKFPEHRESIQSAGQLLFDILDVEQTKATKSFTIKPNYDEEMDTLIQRDRDLPDILSERLSEPVNEVKKLVKSAVHIHYSSQLGCLLMVDITPKMLKTGDYQVDGLKLQFISEDHVYYSSNATEEITEQYGDVKTAITDKSLALMYQLQNTLLPHMASVLELIDLCAELDCYISLGAFCSENKYVKPELVEESVIEVKSSRHALLEVQLDNVIQNDIISNVEGDKAKMVLLTGPNASGKSVYLKQVALVVYLAHIGCFVPAESARIGLVDAIFTHFSMADSVNSNVSTFTSDLRRMASIVSCATDRSLIVLDEFGKGTSPTDGVALLISVLQYWLPTIPSAQCSCPHTFVSTHYHSVCKFNSLLQSPYVQLKMMETLVEGEKVTYLYSLADGAASRSHAAVVARLLDVPHLSRTAQVKASHCPTRHQPSQENEGKHRNIVRQLIATSLDLDDDNQILGLLNSISREA